MKPQLRNSLRRPIHNSNSVDSTKFFVFFFGAGGGGGGKNSFVEAMPIEPRKKGLGKQKKFYDTKQNNK